MNAKRLFSGLLTATVVLAPFATLKPASATEQFNNQLMAQADLSADAKAAARSQAIENLGYTQKGQEIQNKNSSMLLAGKFKDALNKLKNKPENRQPSPSRQGQPSSSRQQESSDRLQRAQENLERRGGNATNPLPPRYEERPRNETQPRNETPPRYEERPQRNETPPPPYERQQR